MNVWYWDDLKEGDTFWSPGRTVTETDVVQFAALSGDYNELHTNAAFAESTAFGQRIAHGLLGLSIASGLFTRTELVARIQTTIVALLGLSWDFRAPIRIGDTVRLAADIAGTRPTKDGTRGIVEVHRRVLNQHDDLVQEGRTPIMVRRRPSDR